jgi:hypothetical protein
MALVCDYIVENCVKYIFELFIAPEGKCGSIAPL